MSMIFRKMEVGWVMFWLGAGAERGSVIDG